MPGTDAPPPRVAGRRYTTPITCCVDGLAHDVTDEDAAAGQRSGVYQAVCGYRVVAAALAAPVGRSCAACTAMTAATQPTTGRARRGRHRCPG
ncbi:MAG: hypothetical protein JO272_16850 [Pseudonocardiales bacterium]|nr:hypothetical protein [Pseudonocardiales bacterium]